MATAPRERVLLISHDVVGDRMAGTGIRSWELARVLARSHDITLVAPQPIEVAPPGVTVGDYRWGDQASLRAWLDTDVVVANGFVLLEHPDLARIAQPLALDLYDPVLLENLELWRDRDARDEQNARDHALLQRQLAAGDFLMCATERQRDLLVGALMSAGRITPTLTDHDPLLRGLIDVVPFGLSADPPRHTHPMLRGVIPGIGADDPIILWTGGLWDWLDPHTLVDAMSAVVARHPNARLVFLAGQHPGAITPMRAPTTTRQRAVERGLLDTHIFFYDSWVPYDERANVLLEADIAVSLHHPHLETAYAAVRSRFLDHLWAGLPSVVADGDAAADLVRTHALGGVVPPGDATATATALVALLDDSDRRADAARNARALAQRFTWDEQARPLVAFCSVPRRTHPDATITVPALTQEQPAPMPTRQGGHPIMQHEQESLLKQLEQSWQFGAVPTSAGGADRLVNQAVLRIVGPMIAQQRTFNATLVKLLYTLQDRQEIETMLNAVMAQLMATERELSALRSEVSATNGEVSALNGDLNARIDTTAAFGGETSARLDVLERDLHARLDTTAAFGGEVNTRLDVLERDLHARLDTLGTYSGNLNDRLTRLAYATQLLDDAVAAGDDLDRALAERIAALVHEGAQEAQP